MFLSTRLSGSRLVPLAALALVLAVSFGCSDEPSNSLTGPQLQSATPFNSRQPEIRAALVAQERHNPRLRAIPGVVGTAVGLNPGGQAVVRVFTATAGVAGIPAGLDNVPVSVEVTGIFSARTDPTTRQRPTFLLGFSVGHPAISAGTAGARVIDLSGKVYILSNNHVLANSNDALINDATLQPGPFDGGVYPTDSMASLADFQVIDFSGGNNTMDAAISLTSAANFGNSTPLDDGYGMPSAALFGDANSDGVFDNKAALLGLAVEKYGRTTKLTHGTITGINASVSVCYDFFIICWLSANYVDQLIITPGTFSGGGDSGSLIVTDDANKNPVGLLFAGSSAQTIANRIDLVLNRFGVTVDGSAGPTPPLPPTGTTVHVGDLDGSATGQGSTWTAHAAGTAHDEAHVAVSGALVTGTWSGGASGGGSCTTGVTGQCTVSKPGIRKKGARVTFTVSGVTHSTLSYNSSSNHDVDGGTDGTTITVAR